MAEQAISPKASLKSKLLGRMARTFGFIRVSKGTVAITDHSGRFNGILGPGLHYAPSCLGYKVTGKLCQDMPLIRFGHFVISSRSIKDPAFMFVEGFVQYKRMAKEGFDLAVAMREPRNAYEIGIFQHLVEMDYASARKDKKGIGEHVDEFVKQGIHLWGIEDCRFVIGSIERFDPRKEIDKFSISDGYWTGPEQLRTSAIEASFMLGGKAKKKGSVEAEKRGNDVTLVGEVKKKNEANKIQPWTEAAMMHV